MFSTLRGGLEWAQSLSAPPKLIITAVVLMLAGLALVLLWQQAPPVEAHGKAPSGGAGALQASVAVNSNAGNATRDVQAPVVGRGNAVAAPKIEQHVTGDHASVQTGSASSTGQTGGVTAGNYYAAPSTPQEKEQQIERLKAELSDLADFPNKVTGVTGVTMLERMSSSKVPGRLHSLLERYVKQTIVGVPVIGDKLLNFKRDYYEFSEAEQGFETAAITSVGPHVAGRLRPAWEIYFRYFLLRSSGHSVDDVKAAGDFLNYGITWEDAERVSGELSLAQAVGPPMQHSIARLVQLQSLAAQLVVAIRAQNF